MTPRYPTDPASSKRTAAFYACYFAVLGVVLPFLGPYLEARGVGAVGIGCITAAFSLAKLVYAPLVGAAVDRGLWFPGLLTAHLWISLSAAIALGALRDEPWLLALAFAAIGLGYGTVLPLVEAAVLERLPARGYGRLRLWGSLGFVAAASLAAPVLASDLVPTFPLLVAAALAALWLCCLPFERVARPAGSSQSRALPWAVWGLLGLLTVHQVAHGPYYTFFSVHLRAGGLSNVTVAGLWSLGVTAELAAFFGGRSLERLLGLRRLLGLALLVTPVRWLLLALPPSLPVLAAAQLGHAVTFALVHLAGVQLVQINVPAGATRHAQALYSGLSFGLGAVAGSALSGPVYGRLGGAGAFLVAAALSVVVLAAWLLLRAGLGEGSTSQGRR